MEAEAIGRLDDVAIRDAELRSRHGSTQDRRTARPCSSRRCRRTARSRRGSAPGCFSTLVPASACAVKRRRRAAQHKRQTGADADAVQPAGQKVAAREHETDSSGSFRDLPSSPPRSCMNLSSPLAAPSLSQLDIDGVLQTTRYSSSRSEFLQLLTRPDVGRPELAAQEVDQERRAPSL